MLTNTSTFTSFSTDDIEATTKFYSEKLGLSVSRNEMGLVEISTSEGHRVLIYPKPDHVPASYTVLNFEVSDIEAEVDYLTGKGIRFEQYDDPIKTDEKGICRDESGPMIAWFKDNAGNILSVVQSNGS